MDSKKFDRLVHEFPFLAKIFADKRLSAEDIGNINICRADRNLLEVEPGGWNHDAGSFNHCGYRNFWIVSPGEIISLKDGFWMAEAYRGSWHEPAGLIANQLIEFLDREIGYIVEITNEWYDWPDCGRTVIIYKMRDFAWRRFCRPASVKQS